MMDDRTILYLVMRNDLPSLNPGKLAAQAAHCANACVAQARKKRDPLLKGWEAQSKQNFGTTIVLGASLDAIQSMSRLTPVWDDTYPCSIPLEVADALLAEGTKEWSAVVTNRGNGVFLRRELVGGYVLANEKPDELEELELYP